MIFDSRLANWNMDPRRKTLGGSSRQSVPGVRMVTGEPMMALEASAQGWTRQFQRLYGAVSDPRGGMWDPRGNRAMVPGNVADYVKGGGLNADRQITSFEAEARKIANGQGMPVWGVGNKNSNVDVTSLVQRGSVALPSAAKLAEALSVQRPDVLRSIQLPVEHGLPRVSNELGVMDNPGTASYNPMYLPEARTILERLAAQQYRPTQQVDTNGVVNKYQYGTGPYDAPGQTRPGGIGALGSVAMDRIKDIWSRLNAKQKAFIGQWFADFVRANPERQVTMWSALPSGVRERLKSLWIGLDPAEKQKIAAWAQQQGAAAQAPAAQASSFAQGSFAPAPPAAPASVFSQAKTDSTWGSGAAQSPSGGTTQYGGGGVTYPSGGGGGYTPDQAAYSSANSGVLPAEKSKAPYILGFIGLAALGGFGIYMAATAKKKGK